MRKHFMYTSLTIVLVCVILFTVGCKSGNISVSDSEENIGNDTDNISNIMISSGETEVLSGDLTSGDEINENFDIEETCIYNE